MRDFRLFLELVGAAWAIGCVGMFLWIFLAAFFDPAGMTLVAVNLYGEAMWEVVPFLALSAASLFALVSACLRRWKW